MDRYTFLSNATPEYLETLYNDFNKDSSFVDPEFNKFFDNIGKLTGTS